MADITNSVEAVQKDLVLERQFLICLNYGNFHAADVSGKCKQKIPYEIMPEIHIQVVVISASADCTCWELKKICILPRGCECPIFALLNIEGQRRLKACISWEQHRRALQLSTPNHRQQLQLLDEKLLRGSSCPRSPFWVWNIWPN